MRVLSVKKGEDKFTLKDRTDVRIFLDDLLEESGVYYQGDVSDSNLYFLLDCFRRREYKLHKNGKSYLLVFNEVFAPKQL